MIGLVLLIGLVAKNSILLVDLTNQRRDEGLPVDAALRQCLSDHASGADDLATVILALAPAAGWASAPATRPTSPWPLR